MDRPRTLVLGLGNLSRRDDGLGWFAVNAVRAHFGRAPLSERDDGLDCLGHEVDTAFVPQLSPELAETASRYDRLVLVDARVVGEEEVRVDEVDAGAVPSSRLLTHEMYAGEFISLINVLYGKRPWAYLVSAGGRDYDFGVGLSGAMQGLLPALIERVLGLIPE